MVNASSISSLKKGSSLKWAAGFNVLPVAASTLSNTAFNLSLVTALILIF